MMRFFRIRTRFGTNWGKWGGGGGGTERGEEERGEKGRRKEGEQVHSITHVYLKGFWSKSTSSYFLTLLKCCNESGLTWHISVTRHTPVSRTPWFFSFKSWRVVGTNTSIRSGTLRTIRTAHSAAWGGGGGEGGSVEEGGQRGGKEGRRRWERGRRERGRKEREVGGMGGGGSGMSKGKAKEKGRRENE